MKTEALPKYLFLHELNEQMQDKRIKVKLEYDQSKTPPQKIYKKKINNTLKFKEQMIQNYQINNLKYSNVLGLLLISIKQQILITDFNHFQNILSSPEKSFDSLKSISASIKFEGKMYLSPDQKKILFVNQDQLIFYDLQKLAVISRGSNEFKIRHFVFINDESFAGWNFLSKAYIYSKINQNLSNHKQFQNINRCTTINVIQKHIIICQKIQMGTDDQGNTLFIYNQNSSQLLNEIYLKKYQNTENYLFNYCQIISIFSIQHEINGKFGANDIFGLVLGYYDDDQSEPDKRYLNFMKGNIIEKNAKIHTRGNQLFLSPTQSRSFYYGTNPQTGQQDLKLPFQVQTCQNGQMILIMIQKLESIFVVDTTAQFSSLNLYLVDPLHQIKVSGGKYFKGMALMKNMLHKQRFPPSQNSNQTCNMICNQFNGQFLSLYFPSKQTQLTVPFPSTILVMGDNKIQRRYAISTIKGVEQYEPQGIKKQISKIKVSPYIQKIKNQIKITPLNQLKLDGVRQSKLIVQVQKKEQQKILSSNLFSTQNTIKNDEVEKKTPSSLFGDLNNKNTLFGKPAEKTQIKKENSSLFGIQTKQTSLFGGISNHQKNTQNNKVSSLFGQKKQYLTNQTKKQDSLFEKAPQSSLFTSVNQTNMGGSNLFGTQHVAKQDKKVQIIKNKQIMKQKQQEEDQQSASNNIILQKINNINVKKDLKKEDKQDSLKQQSKKSASLFSNITPQAFFNKTNSNSNSFITQNNKSVQIKNQKIEIEKFTEEKKSFQKTQKSSQNKILPKQINEISKNNILEEKNLSKNKLNQFALILGYGCVQRLPQPLKMLNIQQIQLLSKSIKSTFKQPSRLQPQKTIQQVARQKLLGKQHFKKTIQAFDNVKLFIKGVKSLNNSIQSQNIFSLQNVKQIIKKDSLLNKQSEISAQNLVSLVRNYSYRMQALQKRYINQIQDEQNQHPNIQSKQKQRQYKIIKRLQKYENQINMAQYYQNSIFPDENIFFKQNIYNNQTQINNILSILKKLSAKSTQIQHNVQDKICQVQSYLNLFNKNNYIKPNRMKLSQISKSSKNSKKNKQKGHFKFSMNSESNTSSENSQEEQQKPYLFKNNIQRASLKIIFNQKDIHKPKKNILIKFKPKIINLNNKNLQISPLFYIAEEQQSFFNNKQLFNTLSSKDGINNNLMNSKRKSVNFKQKIPLNKIGQDNKNTVFIRKGSSNEISDDSDNSEEDILIPVINRNISMLNTQMKQTFVQNQVKNQISSTKNSISISQKQKPLSIKKTEQKQIKIVKKVDQAQKITTKPKQVQQNKDLNNQKKDAKLQLQKAASLFNIQNKNININKEINNKKQEDKLSKNTSKPNNLLFQKQQQNIQKNQQIQQTNKLGQENLLNQKNNQESKSNLFGDKSAPSLFGFQTNTLFTRATSKQIKQSKIQKPLQQNKQLFGSKLQQKQIKQNKKNPEQNKKEEKQIKPFGGLFGGLNKDGENKPSPSLFNLGNKIQQNKNVQQSNKPSLFGGAINKIEQNKKVQLEIKKSPSLFDNSLKTDKNDDSGKKTGLFGASMQNKKEIKKDQSQIKKSSLFGQINKKPQEQVKKQSNFLISKSPSFGISTDKTKKQQPPTKIQQNKNEIKGSLFSFGNVSQSNLFGLDKKADLKQQQTKTNSLVIQKQKGLLFQKSTSNQPDHLKAAKNAEQKVQKKPNGLFGNINNQNNTQNKGGLFFNNKNNQNSIAPQNNSLFSNASNTISTSTFGNNTNSTTNLAPVFGGNIAQQPSFGAQNRFMQNIPTNNQKTESNNNNLFNPNQISLSGFQTNNEKLKTFSDFKPANNSLFGNANNLNNNQPQQKQQNQFQPSQGGLFGGQSSGGLFGQQQQGSMFGQQQGSMFGQQQQQQQQQGGLFGTMPQQQNPAGELFGGGSNNSNFLSSFQVPTNSNQPAPANANLMKMRTNKQMM